MNYKLNRIRRGWRQIVSKDEESENWEVQL